MAIRQLILGPTLLHLPQSIQVFRMVELSHLHGRILALEVLLVLVVGVHSEEAEMQLDIRLHRQLIIHLLRLLTMLPVQDIHRRLQLILRPRLLIPQQVPLIRLLLRLTHLLVLLIVQLVRRTVLHLLRIVRQVPRILRRLLLIRLPVRLIVPLHQPIVPQALHTAQLRPLTVLRVQLTVRLRLLIAPHLLRIVRRARLIVQALLVTVQLVQLIVHHRLLILQARRRIHQDHRDTIHQLLPVPLTIRVHPLLIQNLRVATELQSRLIHENVKY